MSYFSEEAKALLTRFDTAREEESKDKGCFWTRIDEIDDLLEDLVLLFYSYDPNFPLLDKAKANKAWIGGYGNTPDGQFLDSQRNLLLKFIKMLELRGEKSQADKLIAELLKQGRQESDFLDSTD